ncbi:MAG: protein kinase domain-containing protein [Ktedonobacteraceae bacterium]|jgi:eukaryotic-like serine/threonine-protein kinase
MPLSSQLYCNTCGAANQDQAEHCLVCAAPLHAPSREPLLKERYRILVPVGQGGFGAVYKVEDTQGGNRFLAMKEINLSALTAQEAIEATDAFNREVHLLSDLTSPNLPRIYDHFTEREHWYLVTDFIEGETLEQYLNRTRSGRLPLEEVLAIGIQLCTVLDYLHTREPSIIFRDLKPANVMRTSAGHLYLIDFGIARHFKPGQPRDTIPLGSPGYAAPEQYGRAQTTPRADIYSLGALLHQLLTGNNPAQSPFHFDLSPLQGQSLPPRLQSLLLQMVELDANNRPSSILIVKQALEQIVAASRPIGTLLSTCHHYRLVLTLAWSPDGSYIVSGTANSALHVWNATTGCHLFSYRDPFKTYTWTSSLAWSPDGEYIACGSDDRTVRVWQVEKDVSVTMKQKVTYRDHANWVNAVAWAPDGRRIASGSDDKTVQVWQMDSTATGAKIETYRGHSLWVVTLAWSPDGTYIASGGNDATIHIWDVGRKETALIYRDHPFGVNALAWSPDGTRIASCSWDNIIRVWDVVTGNTLFTYHGHSDWVNAVAWSPGGTRIASAGRDKTVQVWDAVTGHLMFTYHGHSGWVYTVAWSPDGTRIASAGNDGTVQVWQAT